MWIETVVCSARKGRSARLRRLLEARQALKKRCDGCSSAWVAPAVSEKNLFLVQAIFTDEKSWRSASERIVAELDSKDGGIEPELVGPPLVGMFQIDEEDLKSSK